MSLVLVACSKSITTDSTGTTTTVTTTRTGAPLIKFFNVMDYGKINILLNNTTATTVAEYYPSSYITAVAGINNVRLYYPYDTTATSLNLNIDLLAGTYYSCFFYRVGNEWKLALIDDDSLPAPVAGYAGIRLLDFRTQAYFDYVNVRVNVPAAGDQIIFKYSNFLDFTTYQSNTTYQTITAGAANIFVYNDTATLYTRKDTLNSGKLYSIILLTPSSLADSVAINYIFPDVEPEN